MQFRNILITALLAAFVGCNNKPETKVDNVPVDTVVDDSHVSTTPIPLDGCYRMILNKDTALLRLNVIDSLVTGELSYHWFEKDRSDGSVKGVIRDSLLIMDYTFRSEGTLSVRQVVFKLVGTSLAEGHGDLDTKRDTVRFANISQLTFQYDHPFIKMPCVE